jgi:hypothetical protein
VLFDQKEKQERKKNLKKKQNRMKALTVFILLTHSLAITTEGNELRRHGTGDTGTTEVKVPRCPGQR